MLLFLLTQLSTFNPQLRAADLVWTNTAGGNWSTAANWNPNQVPGSTDTAWITNSGTYTVTVNVSATVASLQAGGSSGTQTLSLASSTLTLNGASLLDTNCVFAFSGGTLNGTGDATVAGTLNWTGGTMSGSGRTFIGAGGALNMSGTTKTLSRSLQTDGTGNWTAGNLSFSSGTLTNNGTLTVTASANVTMLNASGVIAFNNIGTLNNSGTAFLIINLPFNNSGQVNIIGRSIDLNGVGTHTGNFSIAAGTALNFANSQTFAATCVMSGSGSLTCSAGASTHDGSISLGGPGGSLFMVSGSFTMNGPCQMQRLQQTGGTLTLNGLAGFVGPASSDMSAGTLSGSGDVTVTGTLNWAGGTMSGSGKTIIANTGTLSMLSGGSRTLSRILQNDGTANWGVVASQFRFNSGTFNNNGSFTVNVASDVDALSDAGVNVFNNAGTFTKQGAGNVSFRVNSGGTIGFNNSGTVDVQGGTLTVSSHDFVQTAGLTLLNGGNLTVSQPLQLQGGALAGTNTVTGNVTNNAVVNPGASPGKLTITGDYTQTASGALNIELAGLVAATSFDRLAVTGTASLAGTVNVTLTDGFYPATNANFSFLTCASRSGTFSTFNFPSNDVGMMAVYSATNAAAQVINVRPALPVFAAQTNDELVLFNLNAAGTDDDQPAQTLTYALTNSPAGAGIDPGTGQISWTPTEAQGPLATNITVLVTDNGTPNLTVSRTFAITVNEINVASGLTLPPDQAINEEAPFNATATATDSDLPANTWAFELVSGPTGLSVASDGAIAWTPAEDQGPGSYPVIVRVTDTNTNAVNEQQLSTTNSFSVSVNEVNVAPVVGALTNSTVNPGQMIGFTATATDADLPANGLSFSLVDPPPGATMSNGGVFQWRPRVAQADMTNQFLVRVQDDGAPALSGTNTFTVIVNPLAPVLLTALGLLGGDFSLAVNGPSGPDYFLMASTNLLDWLDISTNLSPATPFEFNDPGAGMFSNRAYRVRLAP